MSSSVDGRSVNGKSVSVQFDWDVNVRWLRLIVASNRKVYVLVTVLSTIVAFSVAFLLPPTYRAETLLAPVSSDKNVLGGLATQFGDLAAIAGINLSGGNETAESIAVLKSYALTEELIKTKDLLPVFFAEEWDVELRRWKSTNKADVPTFLQAYELFNEDIRHITVDKKTGLVTLAIEWSDPEIAARIANELVQLANTRLRRKAIGEADKINDYLQKELLNTNAVEVQQAIYRLIEAQTKNAAWARAHEEYAFKVIDAAVIPEEPIKPNRPLVIVILVVGSLLLTTFVLATRAADNA